MAAHPDSPRGCVEEGQTQGSAPTRYGNQSPRLLSGLQGQRPRATQPGYVAATPTRLRSGCRGRPLCLPIRIAHALRRDAVSCKPHPKIQPAKLHPQIGYRRFIPARGGQVALRFIERSNSFTHLHERGTGAPHLNLQFGFLCPPLTEQRCLPRRHHWFRVLCPPLTEQRCMPRRHQWFRALCPPRAGVDTRPAWPGVDGYELRAASALDNVDRVAEVGRAAEVDGVDSVDRVAGGGAAPDSAAAGSCVPRGRGWTRAPRGRGWTDTGQAQGPVLRKRRAQARCLRYALRKPRLTTAAPSGHSVLCVRPSQHIHASGL